MLNRVSFTGYALRSRPHQSVGKALLRNIWMHIALATVGYTMPYTTHANTLYRCVQADGVTSYASTTTLGARCTSITYKEPKKKPAITKRNATSLQTNTSQDDALAHAPKSDVPKPPRTPKRVTGQVYSYIQDGIRHFSSTRPKTSQFVYQMHVIQYSVIESCFACVKSSRVDFHSIQLNTRSFQPEIMRAAQKYGVDEALIRAVIHAESAYNPMALSYAGAQGLMQLMPTTAQRFGVQNAFDSAQNIQAGVRYLAWLLQHYHGNVALATAGYNAGEAAVDQYRGVPPYDETQHYVQRVSVLMERYRKALQNRLQ